MPWRIWKKLAATDTHCKKATVATLEKDNQLI